VIRILLKWCGVGIVVCAVASPASAQRAVNPKVPPITRVAAAHNAELHGLVQDAHGQPLRGAIVSALGATSAFAISDQDGRFAFRDLPPGPYLLRAHLQEYVPSRGRIVQVSADAQEYVDHRLDPPSGCADAAPVATASIVPVETAEPSEDEHSHDELAWRMRHAKRSVLKGADQAIAELGEHESFLGHAVGTSARLASSLFDDLSMSGQLNLLTTTSFDHPQDLFLDERRGAQERGLPVACGAGCERRLDDARHGDAGRPRVVDCCGIVLASYARRTHAYEAACRTACSAISAATPTRSPRCATAAAMSVRCMRSTAGRWASRFASATARSTHATTT
jgi:hypothetical protein